MLDAQDARDAAQGAVFRVTVGRLVRRVGAGLLLSLLSLTFLVVLGGARPSDAADEAASPYRMIVLLDVRFAQARGTCTGFLVGSHTIATAGHCLYNPEAGGWAVAVGVMPGVDGIDAPFARQTATVFDVAPGYLDGSDPSLDYGAITLSSDLLGAAAGQFGVDAASDARLRSGAFETAGYASGGTWGTQWRMPARRSLVGFDATALTYAWSTTPGMSGAPIFEPGADGYRALGIVTGRVDGRCWSDGCRRSYGRDRCDRCPGRDW